MDIWQPRAGTALQGVDGENAESLAEMAGTVVPFFGAKEMARMQGRIDARGKGYGASRSSGLNWGGMLDGLSGVVGAFGGGSGGSMNVMRKTVSSPFAKSAVPALRVGR